MKIYEVIRIDLDDCCGRKIGTTTIKRYLSSDKAINYKKEWEKRWQNNYDNHNTEEGCCWLDSGKHLEILEAEVEE